MRTMRVMRGMRAVEMVGVAQVAWLSWAEVRSHRAARSPPVAHVVARSHLLLLARRRGSAIPTRARPRAHAGWLGGGRPRRRRTGLFSRGEPTSPARRRGMCMHVSLFFKPWFSTITLSNTVAITRMWFLPQSRFYGFNPSPSPGNGGELETSLSRFTRNLATRVGDIPV